MEGNKKEPRKISFLVGSRCTACDQQTECITSRILIIAQL